MMTKMCCRFPASACTRRPAWDAFLAEVDRDGLRLCSSCEEIVYPDPERKPRPGGRRHVAGRCHFCGAAALSKLPVEGGRADWRSGPMELHMVDGPQPGAVAITKAGSARRHRSVNSQPLCQLNRPSPDRRWTISSGVSRRRPSSICFARPRARTPPKAATGDRRRPTTRTG